MSKKIMEETIKKMKNSLYFNFPSSDVFWFNLYKNFKYSKNRRIRKKQIKKHKIINVKFYKNMFDMILILKITKILKNSLK